MWSDHSCSELMAGAEILHPEGVSPLVYLPLLRCLRCSHPISRDVFWALEGVIQMCCVGLSPPSSPIVHTSAGSESQHQSLPASRRSWDDGSVGKRVCCDLRGLWFISSTHLVHLIANRNPSSSAFEEIRWLLRAPVLLCGNHPSKHTCI